MPEHTELFLPDGTPAGVYYCLACRLFMRHRHHRCGCPQPCIDCGGEVARGWTVCEACRAARERRRMSELLARAERRPDWTGPVFDAAGDYHEDSEAALDCDAPLPWWGARKVSNLVDPEYALDRVCENLDANAEECVRDLPAWRDFYAAVERLNAALDGMIWEEDTSFMVRWPLDLTDV